MSFEADMLANGVPFEVALGEHLRYNLYPPVPFLADVAEQAITAVADYEPHTAIALPNGADLTAQEIVDGLHLEWFVEFKRGEAEPV